jgi:ppGpp synthetase/RelA/SpoT-type nucleotidyltranferase
MSEFEIQEDEVKSLLDRITVDRDIERQIRNRLDKVGMYYRIFVRVKEAGSLCNKLRAKEKEYKAKNKKMQDLIGVRIVLYYADDVVICQKIIEKMFHVRKEDSAVDKPNIDEFKPVRLNLICDIPDEGETYWKRIPEELLKPYRIDQTFEIQIRTILSEGWYEVEHDMRYKHKEEWEEPGYYNYGRRLNGVNATLEGCDNTLLNVFESLSHQCYIDGKVTEMFRYKLRIHVSDEVIKEELKNILDGDRDLLKRFYRLERNKILMALAHPAFGNIPLNLNNIIYICNALYIKNEEINSMTPALIKKDMAWWEEQERKVV